EGFRTILVNSNPATIMTDPEVADKTYIEPLTVEVVAQVIEQERPDAVLPTVGGQTALNLAVALSEQGILNRFGVELIGASVPAVQLAEDRLLFREAMREIGVDVPKSDLARSVADALRIADELGYPVIVRPSFTLGGKGGGMAFSRPELTALADRALRASPVGSALIEESILGWKEFELEVMRDRADNFVVVCSIENLDPMGVHTGDSITVAPIQTLTDREYQRMRDTARRVIRRVGVETGGSNIQFAVNPTDGRQVVIEMNPRVSRSSALASKATGFPIAKIAARLAVGYTLDEIPNDITRETPASFEPTIDYVVVKIPRWDFAKFPGADPTLGPQMKSVGEVMAIGRTFKEAFQKALRSLETGADGLTSYLTPQPPSLAGKGERDGQGDLAPTPLPSLTRGGAGGEVGLSRLLKQIETPTPDRIFQVGDAFRLGATVEQVQEHTWIDPWFLRQIQEIVAFERELRHHASRITLHDLPRDLLWRAKRMGFSDQQLARLLSGDKRQAMAIRQRRLALGIRAVYQRVDTCAAEFEAYTPYMYSTYETSDEAEPTDRQKVVILGSGPNRIGQGIEFDYCCCHAAFALRDLGYETIMVNCNPETVSTDYDTSDRLYFEPVTVEDVLNVVDVEQPLGVIVQLGGQTPLKLALALQAAGVPILGTSPDAIDLAEDRERFGKLLEKLGIPQPPNGTARSLDEAHVVAERIGYPVLVRPSYVLGGRAMAIVYDGLELEQFGREALAVAPDHPLLIDRFLDDAYEVDVDAVADGERVVIGGVLEHIEAAGIHSGDSAAVLPPYKVSAYHMSIMRDYTQALGLALGVRGLMNVQFAIKDDVVYVLEVNPRASRTVPFISKAVDVPLAKIASQIMVGRTLAETGLVEEPRVDGFFVKEAVLPFDRFPGADPALGPEMRSTGEVMGHASRFGHAFAKSQMAAGDRLPLAGKALLSVNDFDKGSILKIGRDLHGLGFTLLATEGTAMWLRLAGLPVETVSKIAEGSNDILDLIRTGGVDMIINTPLGRAAHSDGRAMRMAARQHGIPLFTTLSAAAAGVNAIRALKTRQLRVRSLQDHYRVRTEI
ncbi:MAG: carbamoyl-phosphate synthase large subunit, partial [Anaerolineae bacterium]|nr:carbamoyl-phosphate synthase large subunit [Anaerolineae bacterium]